MSIIARNSFSASVFEEATLYAALVRGGGGFGASESSSSEMTTPFLTCAALLGSVRLEGGFARSLALSCSESESFNVDFLSTAG